MKNATRPLALALTVALTGCLPTLQVDTPHDAGQDASPDTGRDASPDVAPDVAPDARSCPDSDVIAEWCATRGSCGLLTVEGCGEIDCGDRCQPLEACVQNTCVCDDIEITKACTDANLTCGTLPDLLCDATISCDLCEGFSSCNPAQACEVPTVSIMADFRDVNLLRLGTALGYHADTLLIASFGLEDVDNGSATLFHQRLGSADTLRVDPGLPLGTPGASMFGHSLDISGDYAVVGSVGEPSSRPMVGDGAARLFEFIDGVWTPLNTSTNRGNSILAPIDDGTQASADKFSEGVAIEYPLVAVTAPRYEPTEDNEVGRAHLYLFDEGELIPFPGARLEPGGAELEDTYMNANFGTGVELRDRTLFVGAPKAKNDARIRCGLVRAFYINEDFNAIDNTFTLRSPECEVADATSDPARSSLFGSSILDDGAHLFVSAPLYPSGNGPGAIYVFSKTGDRTDPLEFVQRLDLSDAGLPSPQRDTSLTMTRTIDALVIGADGHGHTLVENNPAPLVNEGVVYIFRLENEGNSTPWAFDRWWAPGDIEGTASKFGTSVTSAPDGRAFVSAPSASGIRSDNGLIVRQQGRIYELDLSRR